MKRKIGQWLCAMAAGLFLLGGCASPAKNSTTQINVPVRTETKDVINCTVSLMQNGQELKYELAGFTRIYQLQSAPFRIEVSTDKCDASIGTFKSINDHMFVASNPYVVSPQGMGMASTPHDDVLVRRSEDPRPSPNDLGVFDAQKAEILKLCEDFGRCPTQIYAFRNYWSFLVDAKATRGKIAEITKLNERQSISKAIGLVPIVVYTKAKMDEAEYRTGSSTMDILETHPIFLMFRGPPSQSN